MLHLKTDDELRFFVENPAYYQAELVAAARQELRRRHPVVATPAAPAASPSVPLAAPQEDLPEAAPYIATPEDAPRKANAWVLPTSVAAVLLVAGLGFWHKASQPRSVRAKAAVERPAAPAPHVIPRLETAIAPPPLPTFNVDNYVAQALTRVPTAEKAKEQPLSQYQVISRLFWTAQLPSDLLLTQVQQGQPNPVFQKQAALVLGLWGDFDRTLVYSYHFGPVMSDHFSRMQAIAKQQEAALTSLASAAAANQPLRLTNAQLVAGQQTLPQLLAPLQPRPKKAAHL